MAEKKKKIAFIINPIAGVGNKNKLPVQIEKYINASEFKVKIVYTSYGGHATKLAATFVKKKYDIVVAAGGDGTVNEIAQQLINTKTALAIIPLGSGNGLARHLKIPMFTHDAIKLLNKAKKIKIDYGKINDKYFFCTCGIGFDAIIGHKFAMQKTRGIQTYVGVTMNELFNFKPLDYTLIIDGKEIKKKAFMITFANASQFGNNAFIAPRADITDGLMDVCVVDPFPLFKALGLGFKLFSKRTYKFDHIEYLKAGKIIVKREHKGEIHFDGEPAMMGKKLKIKMYHQKLNVMVPQNFKG